MDEHPALSDDVDEWHEWVRGVKRDAWNQFRDSAPADVDAIVSRLREIEAEKQDQALTLRGNGDEDAFREASVGQYTAMYRRSALEALLEYMALHGPDGIPAFGDILLLEGDQLEAASTLKEWIGRAQEAKYDLSSVEHFNTLFQDAAKEHQEWKKLKRDLRKALRSRDLWPKSDAQELIRLMDSLEIRRKP